MVQHAPTGTPMLGSDILVEALLRQGVDHIFAYPGGASMPIHQSLTKYQDRLRTILPRFEQGGGFAVETLWSNYNLCSQYSNPVHVGRALYGLSAGRLVCVDVETGRRYWRVPAPSHTTRIWDLPQSVTPSSR